MSLSTTEHTFTKEQLFADLETDDVNPKTDVIKKAKNGNVKAFFDLGEEYFYFGQPRSKAFYWYLLAANENYPPAQGAIAALYSQWNASSKDHLLGLEWYLKAAKQLDINACFRIGKMFIDGCGVPVNEHMALEWFYRAKNPLFIKYLEKKGCHISKYDKHKSICKLITETEDVIAHEREKEAAKMEEEKQKLLAESHNPYKEAMKRNIKPSLFRPRKSNHAIQQTIMHEIDTLK